MEDEHKHKGFKASKSGRKAKKKELKKLKDAPKEKGANPKAFSFSGGTISVQRRVQRGLDIKAKKERKPMIDKTPEIDPPPYVVVVQGPKGVGKTTLIRSLVRHYSKQSLSKVVGPITLVSGKVRRLTFIECSQDIRHMLDLAKVADLVLVMIDASVGFEMETFEFLNIMQVHGFPKVVGVMTHLDHFKENKTVRRLKKTIKNSKRNKNIR